MILNRFDFVKIPIFINRGDDQYEVTLMLTFGCRYKCDGAMIIQSSWSAIGYDIYCCSTCEGFKACQNSIDLGRELQQQINQIAVQTLESLNTKPRQFKKRS